MKPPRTPTSIRDSCVPEDDVREDSTARYVYCVIPRTQESDFGAIGLGGARVYPVVAADIAALVHDCPPASYNGDEEALKQWVLAHDTVVREGWRVAGTVLPMVFHTIVGATRGKSAVENVVAWLAEAQAPLRAKLEELRGKAEFGVQLYWRPQQVMAAIARSSDEIARLRREMEAMGPGAAYLWRQRIEGVLRRQMEAKAQEWARSCLEKVARHAARVLPEKVKASGDRETLLSLSVLACQEAVPEIGAELSALRQMAGLEVRFTGPWPPYSFAATVVAEGPSGLLAADGPTPLPRGQEAGSRRRQSEGPCAS